MTSYQKAISTLMGAAFALVAGVGIATASGHEGGDKAGKKGHHMFEKMDTDGDGKISPEEHEAMAAERFSEMDSNGDGFVDKSEMKAHHKAMKEKWKKHKKSCDNK